MDYFHDIDSLIQALYDSICGPAGQARKWDRMRTMFFPGAHMIRTSLAEDGRPQAMVMDVETFIKTASDYFRDHGFYEWEVARRTERFGNIAHAFSTYESRHNADDAQPFGRGINSIQLYHDGGRWWIMNMLWDNEREDNPLPARYLSSGEGAG